MFFNDSMHELYASKLIGGTPIKKALSKQTVSSKMDYKSRFSREWFRDCNFFYRKVTHVEK